jgi:transcriptional regulator with XRE-family HTH domain
MSEAFPKEDLINLRKEMGLTQQQMADQLDMALRSYQAIEAGESEYRFIHRLAAERVALAIAADNKAPALAPPSVRDDAIEVVRVGLLTGNPAFKSAVETDESQVAGEKPTNARFRAAYATVGELVLITTALDHQLNHVLMHVLPLTESPMLESVLATLDIARKIEMLKARSKHIAKPEWSKPLLAYLDKLEKVSRWRNIACHTALIPDGTHGAVFAPAAAAKLLKSLQIGTVTSQRIPISDVEAAIKVAERALGEGQNIIVSFQRLNAARVKKFGK